MNDKLSAVPYILVWLSSEFYRPIHCLLLSEQTERPEHQSRGISSPVQSSILRLQDDVSVF
jgi:hypothetical protein